MPPRPASVNAATAPTPPEPTAPTSDEPEPWFHSEEAAAAYWQNVAFSFDRMPADAQIYLVEFDTRRFARDNRPMTDIVDNSTDDAVRVVGRFRQFKALGKSTGMVWKEEDETIAVQYHSLSGSGDEAYMRLKDVLKCNRQEEPLVLLAIGKKNASRISQFSFMGPLGRTDYVQLQVVLKKMLEKPYDQLKDEDCRRMLESPLVWEKLVGLARLRQSNRVGVRSLPRAQVGCFRRSDRRSGA